MQRCANHNSNRGVGSQEGNLAAGKRMSEGVVVVW